VLVLFFRSAAAKLLLSAEPLGGGGMISHERSTILSLISLGTERPATHEAGSHQQMNHKELSRPGVRHP